MAREGEGKGHKFELYYLIGLTPEEKEILEKKEREEKVKCPYDHTSYNLHH